MLSRTAKSRRRGLVAGLVAVCLFALVGVVAITIDGGTLMAMRRRVAMAADASALAAAVDLANNYTSSHGADPNGTAARSALTTATANGFTSSNSTITVNIPPKSGLFVGVAGYAEVIIQYNQPRLFSAIWSKTALPVSARAVARGQANASDQAVLLLDPNKKGALSITGNGSIKVANGGVMTVDSSNSAAVTLTGNGTISTPTLDVVGNPGVSVVGNGSVQGTVNPGSSAMADPLSGLAAPSTSGMTVQSNSQLSLSGNGSLTLNPGIYNGGISMAGNGTLTLNPGIYYMNGGGFSVAGNGTLQGTGVMIYNTGGGSISMTGNGTVNLTPPTLGTYAGVTIYQDRSSSAAMSLTGNGNVNIEGTIYIPDAAVNLTGNGGLDIDGNPKDTMAGTLIADSVSLTGNGTIGFGNPGGISPTTYDVRLVE